MIVRAWRMPIATSVALAVLIAYSVPARALAGTKSAGKLPAGTAIAQCDDDDENEMSGGALAVLLLAIGGAVAGVLYASRPPPGGGKQCSATDIKKVDSKTIRVSKYTSDDTGKTLHDEWTAKIDPSSRMIKLLKDKIDGAGRLTHSEWTGKIDGRFYPATGNPAADELALTLEGRTLTFTAKKAGQVVVTRSLAASADGQSFTKSTNGVSHVFSARNNNEIPNMGRAPKQAGGVARLDLRVVDQDCNPIQGVRADLQSTLADGFVCESWNQTDARGVAVLPPLHMGTLTLTLTANGYEPQTIPVNAADLDLPVRAVLRKK